MKFRPKPKYVLSIGDLSINQVLQISNACSALSPVLKEKVSGAVQAVWQLHDGYDMAERLWKERCDSYGKK